MQSYWCGELSCSAGYFFKSAVRERFPLITRRCSSAVAVDAGNVCATPRGRICVLILVNRKLQKLRMLLISMSFVTRLMIAQSEMLLAVAELPDIDSAMRAGDAATCVPRIGRMMPVAGGEMSALTVTHFVAHAQGDSRSARKPPRLTPIGHQVVTSGLLRLPT